MSPPTVITKVEGYAITCDEYGNFRCVIDADVILEAKELQLVGVKIRAYLKSLTAFDPVLAISIDDEVTAKITSRDPSSPRHFRITHYPVDSPHEQGKRPLVHYHRREENSNYVRQTPENLVALSGIWGLRGQIKALEVNILNLKANYTDPILLSEFDSK